MALELGNSEEEAHGSSLRLEVRHQVTPMQAVNRSTPLFLESAHGRHRNPN
jgi:hypothetical protein